MATINCTKQHDLGRNKAREVAEKMAKKVKEKLEVEYAWEGDVLRFSRPGVDGSIEVGDSEVNVVVKLGLIFRPLRPIIEQQIDEYLEKHLNHG